MVMKPELGDNNQPMDAGVPDYSASEGDDFEALSRDQFPIRSVRESDLDAIIRIDKKLGGNDRRDYYTAKMNEVMGETGIRVSLVAEVDDHVVGFIMARVDYGEYGRTESAAVIDTIGVDPGFSHYGIASGLMSQLLTNLDALHVERVRSNVSWKNVALISFLDRNGFAPAQQLVLSKAI
jgi:ribosomal protein S18 acetylase RimI-like enzyme